MAGLIACGVIDKIVSAQAELRSKELQHLHRD